MYQTMKQTLLLFTKAKGIVIHVDPTLPAESRGLAHLRIRYPEVRAKYEQARQAGLLNQIHAIEHDDRTWVFFPLSIQDSQAKRLQRVRRGLPQLAKLIADRKLSSVAIPALGCQHRLMSYMQIREDLRSMFEHLHTTQVSVHHSCYFSIVKESRKINHAYPILTPMRLHKLVHPLGLSASGNIGRGAVLRVAIRLGTESMRQLLPPPNGARSQWDDIETTVLVDEPTILNAEMALVDWLTEWGGDEPDASSLYACRVAALLGLEALERQHTLTTFPMMDLPIVMPIARHAEAYWVTLRTRLLGRGWSPADVSVVCGLVESHYTTGRPALGDLVAPGLPMDSRNPADAIVWSYEREREVTLRRWKWAASEGPVAV